MPLKYLDFFLSTPPRSWPSAVRQKLSRGHYVPGVEDLLRAGRLRPQRPYDFLSRYEAILARAIEWRPLDFEGRAVIEIGSGTDLGFAPLAVFRGAERVVCVDPGFQPAVLADVLFRERYLEPLWRDLTAIHGEGTGGDFAGFTAACERRIEGRRATLLNMPEDERFDVMLSNSCLEHVFPVDESVRHLRRLLAPGGRYLHLVDFGNHRSTPGPFDGIYDTEPEDYLRRYGRSINLVRPKEMLALFHQAGFDGARLVPYYEVHRFDGRLLPIWEARTGDDRFVKAALIAGSENDEKETAP